MSTVPEPTIAELNAQYSNLIFTMSNDIVSVYDVVRLEWAIDAQSTKRLRLYLSDGVSRIQLSSEESKAAYQKWLSKRGAHKDVRQEAVYGTDYGEGRVTLKASTKLDKCGG